jgi:hypothetical protein
VTKKKKKEVGDEEVGEGKSWELEERWQILIIVGSKLKVGAGS